MLTRIAPILAVANWTTTHSALFGDQIPTRSPRATPSARRPRAQRSTWASGSAYAGLLADAGNEVWAVDRWREHVEAIRERGLRVEGASGDRIARVRATTEPTEVGEAELVIIATKAMDVQAASESARVLVGPGTLVLSIQNGLGGPDMAASILGEERVAVGVAGGFGASIVEPGRVHHHGLELLRLGERNGPATHRVEAIAQ